MKVGIVGAGADKFTKSSEIKANEAIYQIFQKFGKDMVLISGHSPVKGVDIWSEIIADSLVIPMELKIPKQNKWDAEYGFKQRNLDIARDSDVLYVILVDKYPSNYKDRRFEKCYHCNSTDHVKSGACWTAKQAEKMGKKVVRIVIPQGD